MSINSSHSNGNVVIFNGEYIVLHCDGVEMQFEGKELRELNGTKKGRLYLTTHRMIFINGSSKDTLQSFSIPFFCLFNIELQQPIFGANFIQGTVKAEVGSSWNGQATFKIKFTKGGAIEYGQAMLQAAKLVSRNMTQPPPPYVEMPGPYQMAAPPAYMPPPGFQYGFQPPMHMFPEPPPTNGVFMSPAPPPYPGIYSGAPQQPSGPDAKAAEAAQSAYYDPNNPGFAYMPPPAYTQQSNGYAPSPQQYPPLQGGQYPSQFPPQYPPPQGAEYPQYPPPQGAEYPQYPPMNGAYAAGPTASAPPSYSEATKKSQ